MRGMMRVWVDRRRDGRMGEDGRVDGLPGSYLPRCTKATFDEP